MLPTVLLIGWQRRVRQRKEQLGDDDLCRTDSYLMALVVSKHTDSLQFLVVTLSDFVRSICTQTR